MDEAYVIEVVVQAAAGSTEKMGFDEKAIRPTGIHRRVPRPYPFPYGFIVATTADDGDNLDCYLLTNADLAVGAVVACQVVALLEQHESDERDHKVLAVPLGEDAVLPAGAVATLEAFIGEIFAAYPDVQLTVGPLHPPGVATQFVRDHADHPSSNWEL